MRSVRQKKKIEHYRIPGAFVRLLFDYLERRGIDAVAVLQAAKPLRHELGPEAYSLTQWREMLDRARQHLDDPCLGLHLGQTASAGHFGLLGYLLLNSRTLGDALMRGAKYWRLFRPHAVQMQYRMAGDTVVIEWEAEDGEASATSAEAAATAAAQMLRDVTGQSLTALELGFQHPAPPDQAEYDAFFGCRVAFGQPAIRLCFPIAYLAVPLRDPDPDLLLLLEERADALLAALPSMADLEQTVRECLERLMPSADPTVEQVAELLCLSPRTLQRRLDESGLNFRSLLDDTRRRLAETYLLDPRLQLKDVAHLLGFSEQSAFTRAFRRWNGVSPGEFLRRRH
jgi:AraC-like DNA-binding protein